MNIPITIDHQNCRGFLTLQALSVFNNTVSFAEMWKLNIRAFFMPFKFCTQAIHDTMKTFHIAHCLLKNNDALFILLECVSFYGVTCINIQIHIFLPKIYSFKRFRFVTYEWGYIIQCLFVNLTFPYILHTCWGQETIWHRETDTTAQINVIFMNFYFPLETPFI